MKLLPLTKPSIIPVAMLLSLSVKIVVCAAADDSLPWQTNRLVPQWSDIQPANTVKLSYRSDKSELENGRLLAAAISRLGPGDELQIGAGRYSVPSKLSVNLKGRQDAPIWIVAEDPRSKPMITRPDARQNVVNVGERSSTRYLCFRSLELTGGSTLMRLYDCEDVWIDRCELHHAGAEGITANTHDTKRLYITNNHLHHFESPEATGEAMYLGANHGKFKMSHSVIAGNRVHHCGGKQGDGIEIKQGSYGNWVVGNHVHDTNYPCIIVYGTEDESVNMIERNVCYRSGDNVLQVQGDAIVRNNLLIDGLGAAFASTDHQGKSKNLSVIHNTMVSRRRGAHLSSWNARPGMVFANNVVCTDGGDAINFPGGSDGVTLVGNVFTGRTLGVDGQTSRGHGIRDFVDLRFDGSRRNAELTSESGLLGGADPAHVKLAPTNIKGAVRSRPADAGAF